MQADSRVVDHLVRQIVEAVHPLRILLFGSAARGEMRSDSDLDFLVVVPEGTHRRRTAQYLYRHVSGLGHPFDVVVATPTDLEKYRDTVGLIYREILRDAREVYAA